VVPTHCMYGSEFAVSKLDQPCNGGGGGGEVAPLHFFHLNTVGHDSRIFVCV
jgi:hypothetical protein